MYEGLALFAIGGAVAFPGYLLTQRPEKFADLMKVVWWLFIYSWALSMAFSLGVWHGQKNAATAGIATEVFNIGMSGCAALFLYYVALEVVKRWLIDG